MDPDLRDRFRSTSMHNTVVVNGQQQSRPRGPFHWETAATARGFVWRASEACDYVEGTHDGYTPLAHTRSVLALHGVGWLIVDHILGEGEADADASWHLARRWAAARGTERTVQLTWNEARTAIASTAPIHIIEDVSSPVYGIVEPSPTLRATAAGVLPLSFATFIAATPDVAIDLHLETAAITDLPPAPWHAAAFEVSWRAGSLAVVTAIERTGAPERDNAAPGVLWGTRGLRTNARTAALLTAANGWSEAVMVNGTIVVDARGKPIAEFSSQTADDPGRGPVRVRLKPDTTRN
jgi:hypothetical protein